ncbi:MAG: hypothetical protein ABIT71_26590 [Vicinamibacteraceae bacterium]
MGLAKLVKFAVVLVGLVLLAGGSWLAGRSGIGSVIDPATLPPAERAFAERMRNVTMVGTFTVDGREGRTPRSDRYEIASVEKVGENSWQFNARMDCCGVAGQSGIPIVVPLHFVGDTPVIMMTDSSLPGIGTFTVRLFFHGDRYAGTWQHGQVGGHMSGRLERTGSSPDSALIGSPAPDGGAVSPSKP